MQVPCLRPFLRVSLHGFLDTRLTPSDYDLMLISNEFKLAESVKTRFLPKYVAPQRMTLDFFSCLGAYVYVGRVYNPRLKWGWG